MTSPFDVYRTNGPEADRFDLVSNHGPINSDLLLNFLREVAPSNVLPQIPYGIVADWAIAIPERSQDFYQDLVKMHQKLGTAWTEFTESAPAFVAVLEDAVVPSFSGDNVTTVLRVGGRFEFPRHLVTDLAKVGLSSVGKLTEILESSGVDDAEKIVFTAIAASKTIRRKNKPKHRSPVNSQTIPELTRRFDSWSTDRKIKVLTEAIAGLSIDQKVLMFPEVPDYYDLIETEEGVKLHILRAKLAEGESLERAYQERFSRRLRSHAAEYMSFRNRDGKEEVVLVPKTTHRVTDGPVISPLISWTRQRTGERELVIERGSTPTQYADHYRDGIMGAMLIAYCQPQLREDWPKQLWINKKSQRMGEAQVPLLTLLKQRGLMSSDFVEASESVYT